MRKSPGLDALLEGNGRSAERQLQDLAGSGFALAMQLTGNREDAADVVQDCFHTIFRKRRMFDPHRGQLRAWFLKIVRNRCLDLLRRRARREISAADLPESTARPDERPDRVAERHELLDLVKQHLAAMPQTQREIIVLRDYHDLSYAEIAEVLSIPRGTVMSRLHRARLELRRRMALADR